MPGRQNLLSGKAEAVGSFFFNEEARGGTDRVGLANG